MDFYELQQKIEKYIEDNFNAYLEEQELATPSYVSDYLDFDKYKSSFTVFFDFDSYNFENLSNESMEANLTLDLYFVVRNGISSTLKQKLMQYVSKFYSFFYSDRTLGGTVDFGTITEINNYDAVQGDKGIKITQITMNLELEDED